MHKSVKYFFTAYASIAGALLLVLGALSFAVWAIPTWDALRLVFAVAFILTLAYICCEDEKK